MSTSAARKIDAAPSILASAVVDRRALLKALKIVLPVIERRNTIPVLGCVGVTLGGDRIELHATNIDQHLLTGLDAVTDGACSFALDHPHAFAGLLGKISADTVDLSHDHDNGKLLLTSGAINAEFTTMPVDDLPAVPVIPSEGVRSMQFGGKQLIEAIEKVRFAISTEETRYYLNGIYLHSRKGAPWMVATDGHRMSLFAVAADLDLPTVDCATGWGFIVPRLALPALGEMAKRGAISLQFWEHKWMRAESGAVVMFSKLIDGTYPDFDRVIPANNDKSAIIPTDLLRAAISRCAHAATDKTKALSIAVGPGDVLLKVRSPDGMAITETVELPERDLQRTAFEHGLNARYITEALRQFPGAATYRWADAASPILIYAADVAQADAQHICVQMPMRV